MANNFPSHFDHYQVLQLLGGGSFGDVYLAKDTHLRRQVVLKVLRPHLAQQPDMVTRFMREARAMAKLKHPNIVMVHSVQQTPPYIVMEYVQGSSLAKYLSQKGAWYFGEAAHRGELLSILGQMAAGLDAAHRQQMVHRDVKPANVLIDAHGQVKVTDFGLVKFLQVSSSMMGNSWGVAGTVLYMAPEQSDATRQGEIGPASDIYALGVIAYKMLAGRVPFNGVNSHVVLDAHRRLPPPDPRQFNPQLPADVVPVLACVLDKQPAKRYPTATAFVEALAQASQGQPIGISTGSLGGGVSSARSVPPRSPLKPKKKRRQSLVLVGTLAAVAFLLLLTIVMLAWSSMNNPAVIQETISATQTTEVLSTASPSPEGEEPTQIAIPVTDTPLPITSTPESATSTPESATRTPESATLTPKAATLTPEETSPTATANPPTATPEPPILTAQPPTPIPPTEPPRLNVQPVTMKMVFVPEGEFLMGSVEEDPDANPDELPQHPVYLDAFEIDQTEVTNQMYRTCVEAGVCSLPVDNHLTTSHYNDPQYNNFPVIRVLWDHATTYCQWVGKRLPTEAEWEKAAGSTDGRKYPWGDDAPTSSLANTFESGIGKITAVGSYPKGASFYGALDMAGNVWEWVNDNYDEDYYAVSPEKNPEGPKEDQPYKVIRGGSWLDPAGKSRVQFRGMGMELDMAESRGFRCAR